MLLGDRKLDRLISLIQDSFRVRPNHNPVYVNVGNHYSRISAKQHQIIFGRRGSGKTCLLVHYFKQAQRDNVFPIYIDADEVKRLPYPDILIRLLLSILEGLPSGRRTRPQQFLMRPQRLAERYVDELKRLLDSAEEARVTKSHSAQRAISSQGSASYSAVSIGGSSQEDIREEKTAEFVEQKLNTLERHLQDYKVALRESLAKSKSSSVAIIVDDFYLIKPSVQADVIDYLHRLVRGTDAYLKVGTIRHRTSLVRYDGGQTVGVEPTQDVESIDLDQTFEDLDRTRAYLTEMLRLMARQVGIEDITEEHFSSDGLFELTLASGGVPRDYLNILVEAISAARAQGVQRVTPKYVYKGAARVSYRTKIQSLKNDAGSDAEPLERVLTDVLAFCLREKRKTGFLISQDEAGMLEREHETIKQLMDFKLIHVVEPDTSAASNRPGRYEAYTLDFSFFMEPRRRGIEIIEFWKMSDNHQRKGLREAPLYSLDRLRKVASGEIEPGAGMGTDGLVPSSTEEVLQLDFSDQLQA